MQVATESRRRSDDDDVLRRSLIMQRFQNEVYERLEGKMQPIDLDDTTSEENDDGQDGDEGDKATSSRDLSKCEAPEDFFSRYTEFGERVFRDSGESTRKIRRMIAPLISLQNADQTNLSQAQISDQSASSTSHRISLPNLNVNTENHAIGRPVETNCEFHLPRLVEIPKISETERHGFQLSQANVVKLAGKAKDGRNAALEIEREDVVGRMLSDLEKWFGGEMLVNFTPPPRTVLVYVHSAVTDTEVERSAIVQHVSPLVKDWSRHHVTNSRDPTSLLPDGFSPGVGKEGEGGGVRRVQGGPCSALVVDGQWGLRDTIVKGQTLDKIAVFANKMDAKLFVITMMSQKYGEALLPEEIERVEFESICDVIDKQSQTPSVMSTTGKQEQKEEHKQGDIQEDKHTDKQPADKQPVKHKVLTIDDSVRMSPDDNNNKSQPTPNNASITSNNNKKNFRTRKMSRVDTMKMMTLNRVNSPTLERSRSKSSNSNVTGPGEAASQQQAVAGKQSRDTSLLLTTWYKLDENCVPPVYVLQSTSPSDVTNRSANERAATRSQWRVTSRRLLKLLQDGACHVTKDKTLIKKYFSSAAECDIDLGSDLQPGGRVDGITTSRLLAEQSLWLRREFDDVTQALSDASIRDHLDLMTHAAALDSAQGHRLETFVKDKLEALIPVSRRRHYKIPWTIHGIEPTNNRTHKLYIERLCSDVAEAIASQCFQIKSNEEEGAREMNVSGGGEGDGGSKAGKRDGRRSVENRLIEEWEEHAVCCQKYSRVFYGRETELSDVIRRVIRAQASGPSSASCAGSARPLAVIGNRRGCGLTSFMAQLATHAVKRLRDTTVVVARFVGATAQSTDLVSLLRSICLQISHSYGQNSEQDHAYYWDDYSYWLNFMSRVISLATSTRPIIIVVDSLHNLTDNYGAKRLNWVPESLPPNVHLIVSTVLDPNPSSPASILSQRQLSGRTDILSLGSITRREAQLFLDGRLQQSRRQIKAGQREVVLDSSEKSGSFLYTTLLTSEAVRLQSYDIIDVTSNGVGQTVKSLALCLFARAERQHGEAFVRRTLGYITAACSRYGEGGGVSVGGEVGASPASKAARTGQIGTGEVRGGLTFNELEDLLSIDESAMNEIDDYYRPPLRHLPVMLLVRLLVDLIDFWVTDISDISSGGVGNTALLYWAHAEIQEAADDRYLKQRDKAASYHKIMAEYFMNHYYSHGESKTGAKEKHGSPRHVISQPLYWHVQQTSDGGPDLKGGLGGVESTPRRVSVVVKKSSTSGGDGVDGPLETVTPVSVRVYNTRRITQLPYHYIASQQLESLLANCLCNYEYLHSAIAAKSVTFVLKDIQMALTNLDQMNSDLILLQGALQDSEDVLRKDPDQLGCQLVGRLRRIIDLDKPLAPRDPTKYPYVKLLLDQVRTRTSAPIVLYPSCTCLLPPSGMSHDTLSDHLGVITAVTSSSDGRTALTASRDNTMKVWDVTSRRVIMTIRDVGENVLEIRLGVKETVAVTSETACVRVWGLRDGGVCLMKAGGSLDPATTTVACEGTRLVALYHGQLYMRVWDLERDYHLISETSMDETTQPVQKSSVTCLISANTFGSLILYAYKFSSRAIVYNLSTNSVLRTIRSFQPIGGSIRALAASRDYYVLVVRYPCAKHLDGDHLELFDSKAYDIVRTLKGCAGISGDLVTELHVNARGTHAVAFSGSTTSVGQSYAAIWGLDTSEHRHVMRHNGVSLVGAAKDLSFVLTAASDQSSVYLWDIRSVLLRKDTKDAAPNKAGVKAIYPISSCPRYIATLSTNERELSVWNLTLNRLRGQVVRTEPELCQPSDVVLVQDFRVIVLTQKVYDVVGDHRMSVYRTIKHYDLMTMKFTVSVGNCAIIVAQAGEYRLLLHNEQLVGLSDNRNQLIIWSLTTGHVLFRLKAVFRDSTITARMGYESANRNMTPITQRLIMEQISSGENVWNSRGASAAMTPWTRRTETQTARTRRHLVNEYDIKQAVKERKKEKTNAIEQFLLSADNGTLVTSYYAHHMCVFDALTQKHVSTLESTSSVLHLYVSALTTNGKHLVHVNYDDDVKDTYVTLWKCHAGSVRKRLRHQAGVCAIAITDDASRIVFGKQQTGFDDTHPNHREISGGSEHKGGSLWVWEPLVSGNRTAPTLRQLPDPTGKLDFGLDSRILLSRNSGPLRAFVQGARDVLSVWDVDNGVALSVFTPDARIQSGYFLALEDQVVVFGTNDSRDVVILRLTSDDVKLIGENVFKEIVPVDDEESGDKRERKGEEDEEEDEGKTDRDYDEYDD